jgi:hypothetical protein
LLILLAICGTAFRQIWRVNRAAKLARRDDIRQYSFVLLIAMSILCFHFCFDSMAYVFYLPLMLGLVAAFANAYRPLVLGDPMSEAIPVLSPTMLDRLSTTPVDRQAESKHSTTPVALSARNPYRFGRRR